MPAPPSLVAEPPSPMTTSDTPASALAEISAPRPKEEVTFGSRSESANTEIGLIIHSAEMAQQALKLIDVLKQQGAYRLRFAEGSNDGRIEWVSDDAGQITVLHEEPDSGFWDRTMLELLAPLTPESLL